MGIISLRKIAKLCQTHMIIKALAEDSEPHYTTISNFVSGMSNEIEKVFSEVLLVCNELKLVKGKLPAIDGCRLSSNASKEYSGTKAEGTIMLGDNGHFSEDKNQYIDKVLILNKILNSG